MDEKFKMPKTAILTIEWGFERSPFFREDEIFL